MRDPTNVIPQAPRRKPWNKGKLIGAKPPLRPKQIAGRTRDLAVFNLAIDSKLRVCDIVSLSVEDDPGATERPRYTGQERDVLPGQSRNAQVDPGRWAQAESEAPRNSSSGIAAWRRDPGGSARICRGSAPGPLPCGRAHLFAVDGDTRITSVKPTPQMVQRR
jgi:hypothetical protein